MLALIQKIEAADAVHIAGLREDGKKEGEVRATLLEKKRANLRVARAVQNTKLRAARTRSAANGRTNMAKTGEIVTLTLTPEQSKQFAAVLGAPDTTLLTMPANRVEVAEYRGGQGDGLITLHLRDPRVAKAEGDLRHCEF